MKGLQFLSGLTPDSALAVGIAERFGSLEDFYKKTFGLHFRIYQVTRQLPDDWLERQRSKFHERMLKELDEVQSDALYEILSELEKVNNWVEQCDEVWGWEITDDIGSDCDEIKANKKKKDFEQFMNRHGNSKFPTLKQWIADLK